MKLEWKIEKRKVSELKNWEKNPRKITADGFQKLKDRITKRGFHDVVKIDVDNTVLSGNMRKRALEELGIEEVHVIVPNRELTDEERDAVALESNRNDGLWDWEKLANEFDVNFLQDIGFLSNELGFLKSKKEDDDVPEKKETIEIKTGDFFKLGEHYILCGDATNSADIEKLLGDKKVKLCFTSPPPYNMANEKYYNSYKDDLGSEEYIQFNIQVIKLLESRIKGFLFWNMSYNKNSRKEWIEVFYRITKETGFRFLESVVWDKGHGMPITQTDALTRQFESILAVENDEHEIDRVFLGANEDKLSFNKINKKKLTNYWYIDTYNSQNHSNWACFPVALPLKAIEITTNVGDVIIDPFLGSGTTLIAAEKAKRKCYGLEKDPLYIDITIRRWEEYTGQKAEKLN